MVDFQDYSAYLLAVKYDAVNLGVFVVERMLNGGSRDDLFAFFGAGVVWVRCLLCTITESLLVVEDELLAVVFLQGDKDNG